LKLVFGYFSIKILNMKYLLSIILISILTIQSNAQQSNAIAGPNTLKYGELGNFKLQSGQEIINCKLGYRVFGALNKEKTNAILFPTWFQGTTKQIITWVPGLFKTIDTNKFCLILVDAFGDGISSSPSNSKDQHGNLFPKFTIKDMVASEHLLLTSILGIQKLDAVIGISMGGMQAFQWSIDYPNFMNKIVSVVGTPQLYSHDLIGLNILSAIIESDKDFQMGNNSNISTASKFLEYMLTTAEDKTKTMNRDSFFVWKKNMEEQKPGDWNNFYLQLNAWKQIDIANEYKGSLRIAAEKTKAKFLIIVNEQDRLVNSLSSIDLANFVNAKLIKLNDESGHTACFKLWNSPLISENIIHFLNN